MKKCKLNVRVALTVDQFYSIMKEKVVELIFKTLWCLIIGVSLVLVAYFGGF